MNVVEVFCDYRKTYTERVELFNMTVQAYGVSGYLSPSQADAGRPLIIYPMHRVWKVVM